MPALESLPVLVRLWLRHRPGNRHRLPRELAQVRSPGPRQPFRLMSLPPSRLILADEGADLPLAQDGASLLIQSSVGCGSSPTGPHREASAGERLVSAACSATITTSVSHRRPARSARSLSRVTMVRRYSCWDVETRSRSRSSRAAMSESSK